MLVYLTTCVTEKAVGIPTILFRIKLKSKPPSPSLKLKLPFKVWLLKYENGIVIYLFAHAFSLCLSQGLRQFLLKVIFAVSAWY